MKTKRTPDENYFKGGHVKFSTSKMDGELYFKIVLWNPDGTRLSTSEEGKVQDQAHLKKLQEMEN